ncbi:DnaJ C-terminal domain-containing protein [Suttonella ornithocola]|uniref:Curved DNA-binding protein n=1 Tax=Suttonella ornithocola TaxID=279832 RepID=A0A380MT89_9GAMM|nr:DnaJ C-terminal domain-containing protein [Suttonella ornithocola]SUO95512.1 Curved DNA-binding protein [Suttonella ornithocola]
MTAKTYYETLGVAKDADAATIKKAYHKLIRKYHPDISKEPDAAQKTSEINAAYDVLKDKDKRAEYDAMLANPFGQAGQGNPFSGFGQGQGGTHFYYEDAGGQPFGQGDFHFEDLFSAFSGARGGTHRQQRSTAPIKGEDQHAELTIDLKAAYEGASRTLKLGVPSIDEHGQLRQQEKTLNVKIPKGISEGQQIRLAGQGMAGINGGENGDLYLAIRFREQDNVHVKNRVDVYQTMNIYPWQAALGGKTTFHTVAGGLQVNLPENIQSGRTIRLKGKGIPAKTPGDLYLTFNIIVPKMENEADKALWQKVAEHFSSKG